MPSEALSHIRQHLRKALRHLATIQFHLGARICRLWRLGDYTGTRVLRHSMGTFSRIVGGQEIAQSMLPYSSARQTEGYARLDVNEKVTGITIRAEKLLE